MMLHPVLSAPGLADSPVAGSVRRLADRYGYSPAAAERAPARCADILALLAAQLREQRQRGSLFLIGDALSALDIHWAVFAALVAPLPADLCPMPEFLRSQYAATGSVVAGALDPALLEHRDAIYREHLLLPLDF
jgi:glutathione S-transferase